MVCCIFIFLWKPRSSFRYILWSSTLRKLYPPYASLGSGDDYWIVVRTSLLNARVKLALFRKGGHSIEPLSNFEK